VLDAIFLRLGAVMLIDGVGEMKELFELFMKFIILRCFLSETHIITEKQRIGRYGENIFYFS
jgi:hypothetical protein